MVTGHLISVFCNMRLSILGNMSMLTYPLTPSLLRMQCTVDLPVIGG